MTGKVAEHLKQRIERIETKMQLIKNDIATWQHNIVTLEEKMFAYKVERQALKHAFNSWNPPEE